MFIILLQGEIILIFFKVRSHLMGYCNKNRHIMLHNLKENEPNHAFHRESLLKKCLSLIM